MFVWPLYLSFSISILYFFHHYYFLFFLCVCLSFPTPWKTCNKAINSCCSFPDETWKTTETQETRIFSVFTFNFVELNWFFEFLSFSPFFLDWPETSFREQTFIPLKNFQDGKKIHFVCVSVLSPFGTFATLAQCGVAEILVLKEEGFLRTQAITWRSI